MILVAAAMYLTVYCIVLYCIVLYCIVLIDNYFTWSLLDLSRGWVGFWMPSYKYSVV